MCSLRQAKTRFPPDAAVPKKNEQVCSTTGGYPYLQEAKSGSEALSSVVHLYSSGAATPATGLFTSKLGWSLLESIVVCAAVTTFGLFAGFRVGSKQASRVPTAGPGPILL